jgi:plastocyanin
MTQHYSLAGEGSPRALPARLLTRRSLAARLAVPLTLAALAAAQLACGAGGQSGGGGSTADSSVPPADGSVSVEARLFGFELSTDTANAGAVTFVVSNDEFLPHDFRLYGNGLDEQTDRINQGETATLTVDLEPGTYTYLCTVEGHDENMTGTFTVK